MTDEWKEFKTYTGQPVYAAENGKDVAFLCRISLDMLGDFSGFGRVLSIVARGYLFHDKDGKLLPGSAYERIERARNALCAWCSVPKAKDDTIPPTDHRELTADFPELVDEDGKGRFYRHMKDVFSFVKKHPGLVSKPNRDKCEKMKNGFTRRWRKKAQHLQVPLFSVNDKAAWGLCFDSVIADALEAGSLRKGEYVLPQNVLTKLDDIDLNGVPRDVAEEVLRFYYVNRTDDTPWAVLPVVNFDAYYGNTNFSRKWLCKLPKEVFVREVSNKGVSRIRIELEE